MSAGYVDIPYLRRQDATYLVRLWSPPRDVGIKAVLVDVHGGAWCDNDRKSGHFYDKQLAEAGYVVAAIDFRCGPEFHHPVASIDVNAAVHWARLLARRIEAKHTDVVTLGSSSGGHLALLAALRPHVADDNETELWIDNDWVSEDFVEGRVLAVGVFWAPVDPLSRFRYAAGLNNRLGQRLVKNSLAYFGSEEAMHDASIARVVSEDGIDVLPRVWFAQAGRDQNVPAEIVETLGQAYQSVGGLFEVAAYPQSRHGFAHSDGEDSQRFIRDLVSWLDDIFEPQSSARAY